MKKIALVLLVVLAATFAFVGCNTDKTKNSGDNLTSASNQTVASDSQTESDQSTSDSTTQPESQTFTITVVGGEGGGEYEEGAEVTVTATVPEGKQFVVWMNGESEVSTENPYTFTASADMTLTAQFEDIPAVKYTITVVGGEGGGEYEEGAEVTVTATVPEGKQFVEWQVAGAKVSESASYSFEVIEDVTLTAVFKDDIHFGAIEVTESYIYATDFSQESFSNSGKALSFEYMPIGESSGTDTILFTIWTINWSPRITELVTVDVVADTISGAVGKIEDIGEGWRRITINCSDMPICTSTADGSETAGLLYFNTVNHAFLLDNVGFVNEDVHIGAEEFTSSNAWADGVANHYFVTPSDSKVIDPTKDTVTFDVKFTSTSGQLSFYLNEYYYGRYCGPFTLTAAGVLTGTGATLTILNGMDEGWYRIAINLAATVKSATAPNFVSRVNLVGTTANGFIKYMGCEGPEEPEEPDVLHEGATAFVAGTAGGFYFTENPSTSGVDNDKTVVFDVKFTSGSDSMINFLLRKYWFGAHYGNDYFTVYADGTTSDASVKTEFVDGGWMRIKINLASAPQAGNPEYVSKIEWTAATTGSGLIKYMGYED